MFRYIALIWDGRDAGAQRDADAVAARVHAQRTAWVRVLDCAGTRVFCAGARADSAAARLLTQQEGVLLGTVFRRASDAESPRVPATLSAEESLRVARSPSEHLINHYWGSYVAVISRASGETAVIRSPSGSLPCLLASHGSVRILFSYMPDCLDLGLIRFSINWGYVAGYLVRSRQPGHTGLNEVREVYCGECLTFAAGAMSTRRCWDPRAIAADVLEDEDEAVRAVRATTRACVQAWASGHQHILHNLSGGLDSSIVLSCLQDAPTRPPVTCVTHHSAGSNSDERPFARLAAQRAGYELVEFQGGTSIDLKSALDAKVSESPQRYAGRLGARRIEVGLADKYGTTAIFTGNRGDEIFLTTSRFIAGDYVRCHGIDARLLSIIACRAEREGLSIWKIFGEALVQGFGRAHCNNVDRALQYHTLANHEVIRELHRPASFTSAADAKSAPIPLGKQLHILSTLAPEPYYFPFEGEDEPQQIGPLMSQPLLELCLRIPTYVLVSRGWDRAIARKAFKADLPEEIFRRRAKGGVGEFTADVLRRNIPFARELLLDGFLVGQGVLDRRRLEEALSERPTGIMKGMASIFGYLNVEAWLQIWARNNAATAT